MDTLHQLVTFFAEYGYVSVFLVLVACGFGLPLPEDITLVSSGVLCGLTPELNVHLMVVITLAGVLIGDGAMFMLGHWLGAKVKRLPLLQRIFTENVYRKMQDKVHRYGNWVLFVARFLPGLRAPIFITAGISRKVSYLKFMAMDGTAALISVPGWVYAGYYFSHDLNNLLNWLKHSEVFILSTLGVVVGVWVCFNVVKKYKSNAK